MPPQHDLIYGLVRSQLASGGPGVISPPVDLQANQSYAWGFLICLGLVTVATLLYAVIDAWHTRSPFLTLLILGGATFGAFAVEPTYDIIMATWYPYDLPIQLLSVVGRPMALMVVLAWVQIGVTAYISYRIVIAGWSAARALALFAAMSLCEGVMEMLCVHFGVMNYYGNHAAIFGVPLPSLIQNAGMFAVIGVALAALVPHLRGWRWVMVPFAVGMLYLGYVLSCTWPNFLAIHGRAPIPLFWLAAVVSSVFNGGVAVAALYLPTARQYRPDAPARPRQGRHSHSDVEPASA
ncbi:MAG: hypothetical protein WCE30_18825 [Mycobacterium sp.]